MKNEAINRFISGFAAIDIAVTVLRNANKEFNENNKSIIDEELEKSLNIVNDEFFVIENTIDEIENNLYGIDNLEDRSRYIKSILRKLKIPAGYLDYESIIEIEIGNKKYGLSAKVTLELIDAYICSRIVLKDMNKYQEYIIQCFSLMNIFGSRLDGLCLSFDIDFLKMQNDSGIFIQRRHRWDILNYYGVKQSIEQPPGFVALLQHPSPEIFAQKIKSEFSSIIGSGRDSAALYTALEKLKFMKYVESNTLIFNAMTDFFGNIGNIKGFNNYLNPTHQNNKNLKTRGIIEKFIDRLTKLNSQQ